MFLAYSIQILGGVILILYIIILKRRIIENLPTYSILPLWKKYFIALGIPSFCLSLQILAFIINTNINWAYLIITAGVIYGIISIIHTLYNKSFFNNFS